MGLMQFGVPVDLALWARDHFNLNTFVETGTNKGGTAVWASSNFPNVITIEGQERLFSDAVAKHSHLTNIRFLHGDSASLLRPTLRELGQPALLWLDAHWCGEGTFGPQSECPLLAEIAAANASSAAHVILIDDARYFTCPPRPPHNSSDWPDLLAITAALSAGPIPRYCLIYRDVIVVVPASARAEVVRFVHGALAAAEVPPRLPLPQRIARGLWARSRRLLMHRTSRGDRPV